MILRHSPDVAWTDGDRVALLDLAHPDRAPLVLEEPAASIWVEADGHDLAELVEIVAGEFGVDAVSIRSDVEELVADLVERGLLLSDRRAD